MSFKKLAILACAAFIITNYQLQANDNYQNSTPRQSVGGSNQTSNANTIQKKIQWHTNYNQAASIAQKDNKPLLLFFTGSDWCGWCKKIDKEVFETPDFASMMANRFIFVKLDFPMKNLLSPEEAQNNATLKQKYGVSGFPTIVILDSKGNFLAETGYRPGGGKEYADYLMSLLPKS